MPTFKELFANDETDYVYQAQRLAVDFLADVNREMVSQNINNSELARKMSVSAAYVTKLFRGYSNPSLETLAKLAIAVDRRIEICLARRDASVSDWRQALTSQTKPAHLARESAPRQSAVVLHWKNGTDLIANTYPRAGSSNSDFYENETCLAA